MQPVPVGIDLQTYAAIDMVNGPNQFSIHRAARALDANRDEPRYGAV